MYRHLILASAMITASCTKDLHDGHAHESELDFNAAEHLIIGDEAYKKICDNNVVCPDTIYRKDGKMDYTYGELITFAGDFYHTIDEMYLEGEKSFWNFFRNDIVDTKKLFYKEAEYVQAQRHGHAEGSYPDFNPQFAWNFPKYIKIAEDNLEHFGFHNVLRYVQEHKKALEFAYQASALRDSNPREAKKLLEKAFFYNGFADHFLTDGFAAGHIRNPRLQINEWALARGLDLKDAGILTKILHDRDGEVISSGAHGLPVTNSRGDTWFARCDAQLFFNYQEGVTGIDIAVESIVVSIQEILDAYDGHLPADTYKALDYVPFVQDSYASLYQIFHENGGSALRSDILSNVDWYFKIPGVTSVNDSVLAEFFSDLEHIMSDFGESVAMEIQKDDERIQYIPQAYLDAYQVVR